MHIASAEHWRVYVIPSEVAVSYQCSNRARTGEMFLKTKSTSLSLNNIFLGLTRLYSFIYRHKCTSTTTFAVQQA